MKKIYIVTGSAGQYSDYRSWSVIAVENEEVGKRYVESLEVLLRICKNKFKDRYNHVLDRKKIMEILDPYHDGYGDEDHGYHLEEIELFDDEQADTKLKNIIFDLLK